MKIALTTSGNDSNAALDGRFGRAPRFLVYDTESETSEVIDNTQNLNAPRGAGVQSALAIAESGAEAIITGHCGPKALQVLSQAGIAVYQSEAATISEALEQFKQGSLQALAQADVDSHWL